MSWKTTLIGILVFLEPLIQALIAALDDKPETIADWNMVVIAGAALLGFGMAKDADKSTEDHQANGGSSGDPANVAGSIGNPWSL